MTYPLDSQIEELKGGSVGPVRILEHEQDRFLTREILELVEQSRKRAAALPVRQGVEEDEPRIPVAEWDRQERSKKRCRVLNARSGYRQKRFQLVEALLGRIVCLKSGCEPIGR